MLQRGPSTLTLNTDSFPTITPCGRACFSSPVQWEGNGDPQGHPSHTTTVWQKWGTRTPYLLFFLLSLNVPVFPFQKRLGNSNTNVLVLSASHWQGVSWTGGSTQERRRREAAAAVHSSGWNCDCKAGAPRASWRTSEKDDPLTANLVCQWEIINIK